MQTKDLVLNESSQWKVVEQICEVFPDIGIAIFSEAFVIKTIDLGDLT